MNASKVRVGSIGGVVEGGGGGGDGDGVVHPQSSSMESRAEHWRVESRRAESSRVELCKWPDNGRKSAPKQATPLLWHVACGSVICLGCCWEVVGVDRAAFSSLRPVACLACCQRITKQHVQHISNGSCSLERTLGKREGGGWWA